MHHTPLPPSLAAQATGPSGPLSFRAALSRHSLFRRLSPEALQDVERRMRSRRVACGSRITTRQTGGAALCLIQRGLVRQIIESGGARRLVIANYGPGEVFGEPDVIDGEGPSDAIEALVDTTLLLVSREDFQQHVERFPETATALLMELGRRMRHRNATIRNLLMRDAQARVVHALSGIARDVGRHLRCRIGRSRTKTDVVAVPRVSHRELSELVGLRRETVSRTLAALTRERLIQNHGAEVLIAASLIETALG